jgi:hypothetical protein
MSVFGASGALVVTAVTGFLLQLLLPFRASGEQHAAQAPPSAATA